MIEKNIDSIEDSDFGFSFLEASNPSPLTKKKRDNITQEDPQKVIADLNTRLIRLHQAITPLLDNLSKNPDKITIHWPDRIAKVSAYRKKIQDIVEGK